MNKNTSVLKTELKRELKNISTWWSTTAWDKSSASLFGEVGPDGQPNHDANKGVILYTRALWFYSTAAQSSNDDVLRKLADSAYDYIEAHFIDRQHGGVFWELAANGELISARKQTFAQAFALYAYSAYYALTQDTDVLAKAYTLFDLIESNTCDSEFGGHYAAFAQDWQSLENMAIDENDIDEPKTLDTELHLLEAYTELYRVSPSTKVCNAIVDCLNVFDSHFLNRQEWSFRTHFTQGWQDRSKVIIFGHVFETAWLIWDAVAAIKTASDHSAHWQPIVMELIENGLRQFTSAHHSVYENLNLETKQISVNSVWWIQAETLVAYLVAHQISGNEKFIHAFQDLWAWTNTHHVDTGDTDYGEWHALINQNNIAEDVPKSFMWKGPYHNGRAMLKACDYFQAESSLD